MNVTALADFSVNLTVRWWVDTTETTIAASTSEIQEHVMVSFEEHGISIPYPVREVKVSNVTPELSLNKSSDA